MKRVPLLSLLVRRHPVASKKELHARILCGEVRVNDETIRDPSRLVDETAMIEMRSRRKYVSRGGDKLAAALAALAIDCRDKIFLDCGASTGGFTDCLLAQGARHVYAVDVGHAQFDYSLRNEPRVSLYERTNIMSLTPQAFDRPPQAAVVDLSFRSLSGAARHILGLVSEGWALALVKPQFEWERPPEDFDGVVRDDAARKRILYTCAEKLIEERVFLRATFASPLEGAKGNREYFFLLSNREESSLAAAIDLIDALFQTGIDNRYT